MEDYQYIELVRLLKAILIELKDIHANTPDLDNIYSEVRNIKSAVNEVKTAIESLDLGE
jgi:hypothetical protein